MLRVGEIVFPKGKAHQLVIQYQMVNPERIYVVCVSVCESVCECECVCECVSVCESV